MSSQHYFEQETKKIKGYNKWLIAGLEFILKAENALCGSIRKKANKKLQELQKDQEEQDWHKHQPKR